MDCLHIFKMTQRTSALLKIMYGNFIFSAVLYILAMQMLLSNLSVQKESEREQDCEKERERTGDSAEKGSIIINKKKRI